MDLLQKFMNYPLIITILFLYISTTQNFVVIDNILWLNSACINKKYSVTIYNFERNLATDSRREKEMFKEWLRAEPSLVT